MAGPAFLPPDSEECKQFTENLEKVISTSTEIKGRANEILKRVFQGVQNKLELLQEVRPMYNQALRVTMQLPIPESYIHKNQAHLDPISSENPEDVKREMGHNTNRLMNFFMANADAETKSAFDRMLRLQGVIHSNLAHTEFLGERYPECVTACKKAIGVDPKCIKAYFRAGKASFELGLYDQALQYCRDGQKNCGENEDIKKLILQIQSKTSITTSEREELMESRAEFQELQKSLEGVNLSVTTLQTEISQNKFIEEQRANQNEGVFSAIGRVFLKQDPNAYLIKVREDRIKKEEELEVVQKKKDGLDTRLVKMHRRLQTLESKLSKSPEL